MSTRLSSLRRRRAEAQLRLEAAERRHRGGVSDARKRFERATTEILRAEINRRTAAPLLRAQAAREQTGDLFSQIGA